MYLNIYLLIILFNTKSTLSQMQMQFKKLSLVLEVTQGLENFYKFDNFIIYRIKDPSSIKSSNLSLYDRVKHLENDREKGFARVFNQHAKTPIMLFTIDPWSYKNDTAAIPNLGNILTNKNLALVFLDDIYNQDLKEFVALSLGASLETKIVFFLTSFELTDIKVTIRLEKLQQFFRWCWSKNILNAILIFQKYHFTNLTDLTMEILSYTPFPKPIELINLTALHASQYYPQKTLNLRGYEFRTPVMPNKPSVFKLKNRKTGKITITGTVGRLYVEFVHQMNATFYEVPSDHIKEDKGTARTGYTISLLDKGLIDVGIHPYSFLLNKQRSGSYPITHSNSCVVIPVVPEINRAYYILYTYNSTIWQYILITFVLFSLLQIMANYQQFQHFSPDTAFAITLTGLLNLPSNFQQYHFKNNILLVTQRSIQISLMIAGLIFTQMFVTSLTSLLSTTIYGKQYETVEDLRAANITLMLLDYQQNLYQRLNILPSEFNTNIIVRDSETISRHQAALNTSYGYIVYQEEWKAMRRRQASFWKPIFRIASKLCISNVYLTLPVQFNSPFYEPLKQFTLLAHAGGLENKWSNMVYSDIQQDSKRMEEHYIENIKHPASITLEHLILLWCIWIGGIFLASIVFYAELCFG